MSIFSYAGQALKMTNPIDATKEIFRAGAESVKMAIESPKRWISDPTNVVQNVLMDVEQVSKTVPYMNQTMTNDDIPLKSDLTTPIFNQSAYAEYQKEKAAEEAAMARHMAEVRESISKSAADASESAGRRSAAQAAYDAGIRAAQEAAYNSGINANQESANSVVQNANEIAVTYPDGTYGIIEDAQSASMVPYTNQRSGLNVTALFVYGLIGYGIYKLITGNKKKGD